MAKNFRTPCDDVQDLLASKGINTIPTDKWVVGQTYFTLGLDEWCYPCVTHTRYLGVVAEGEHKGMFHFYGDSVHYVVNEIDLYDNTFTNLMTMQNACKSVINNG
ncbi:MAG: hypothetical protein II670_12795 [Alphaproteobacteria bacterium]|nr:hypothetical protein [Alphaproteobacteria bacterium]